MKAYNQTKDREPLSITQISSINIFEPPPDMLPSGLLYDPYSNPADYHQGNIRMQKYHPLGERGKLIVKDGSPLSKQGEPLGKFDGKLQNWEMTPPSIEHIVIENQFNEHQRLVHDHKFKIMDIFADKQTLSSKVFPTQKSSLGRQGIMKEKSIESTKVVGRGSSVQVEAQCQQIEKQIASLQSENSKMHSLLTVLSKQKGNRNFINYNHIDPIYVKMLIQQQLRSRGVIIK